MKMVTLKNHTEEALSLVNVTMMSLRSLMKKSPMALYELVMKCKDNGHVCFGNTGKNLRNLSLVQANGLVHGSIKNIVLSAVEGDGFDMVLTNPVQP